VPYSYRPQAITLLPSRKLAACIIAMNVEPRKIGEAARCLSLPSSVLSKNRLGIVTSICYN
jgi:hypothetical protein